MYNFKIKSLLLIFLISFNLNAEKLNDHGFLPIYKDGCYSNPNDKSYTTNSLYKFVHEAFTSQVPVFCMGIRGRIGRLKSKIDYSKWYDPQEVAESSKKLSISWIGHSTFLIQINNINILTDPIFEDLNFFVYRRFFQPGISLDKLPEIHFIIISHNHLDHMSLQSLQKLKILFPSVKILVPQGNKCYFDENIFDESVIEYNTWWQRETFKILESEIKFTLLPACHSSQRTPLDTNVALWGSWMIESDSKTIYFAGDTAYDIHFKLISESFSKIDVALMPIGPNSPRTFVENMHICAKEAALAFLDLKAKHFIPMHWGTFALGSDIFDEPINEIQSLWKNNDYDNKFVHVMKIGQRDANFY